ncbi:MAG: 50S ribosomal protein L6 [Gammaproteobacteria bacterium]|nr:50S ribosomal protein L6 [Pseudomonadota bacterium]MCH9662676.1 50S ribosomal protein L6 [Gammaproteobacteria bacterium]
MSRFSNKPIPLPTGVSCKLNAEHITVRGSLGELSLTLHERVSVSVDDSGIHVKAPADIGMNPLVGTYCRLLANNVHGVSKGFERKLELVGVGYRAAMSGKKLVLQLGFSHPVEMIPPQGLSIEVPVQTQIIVKGIDKHMVNQYAANIRSWRPPEPYKGKGVKYDDEVIVRKEVKKK